jgi:hypothetical protein
LKTSGSLVAIPAPIWTVQPPLQPADPVVIAAQVDPPVPPPPAKLFGPAQWMKTFKTENARQVGLDELVADNPVVPEDLAHQETAWELMQSQIGDGGNGKHKQKRGALGGGSHAVVRRFEFYKYAGAVDPVTGQALCADGLCATPADSEIGDFIGAQNGAMNLNVPAQYSVTLLTSPMPISSGGKYMDISSVHFVSIGGIALFDAAGDVNGAAVVDGGKVNMQFTSPNGTFGATADYPIMTVALRLNPTVQHGQVFRAVLDQSASFWRNLLGLPIAVELQPGSITVGGSVSITNVVPGGGALPAGGTFRILGMGFSPQTKVQLNPLKASSIQYVSPGEIRVTVRDGGVMDGAKILVSNPGQILGHLSFLPARRAGGGECASAAVADGARIFEPNDV